MRLHVFPTSTGSRAVLHFVREAAIPLEVVIVDLMTAAQRSPDFTALNPCQMVPVLEDGDFVLTQTSAILKYLAEKSGSAWYPSAAIDRARVNERMDWFSTDFSRAFVYDLVYPQCLPDHARTPETAQTATLERARALAISRLEVLDRHFLGANPFVCGESITIADSLGAANVSLGDLIGVDLAAYPNVARWLGTIRAREAWQAIDRPFAGWAGALRDKSFVTIR